MMGKVKYLSFFSIVVFALLTAVVVADGRDDGTVPPHPFPDRTPVPTATPEQYSDVWWIEKLRTALKQEKEQRKEYEEEVERLSAVVDPLQAEVERLREYEYVASLVDEIDSLRSTRNRLQEETAINRALYEEARADLYDAWADNTKLADILEKYGTEDVWLNQLEFSSSMEPNFGADDVGLMMKAYEPLNVEDIAYYVYPYDDFWNPEDPENCTWREPSTNVVGHRVISRWYDGGWEYRMKGDANHIPDPCHVPHSAVQWVTPWDAVIQGVLD